MIQHKDVPRRIVLGADRLRRITLRPLPPSEVVYEGFGEYHSWFSAPGCHECPYARAFPMSYGTPMDCGFSRPAHLQPYSVRSVFLQLALRLDFPCKYFPTSRKSEWGEIEWTDKCMTKCRGEGPASNLYPCAVATGWSEREECEGWNYLANLCQSDAERRFLFHYLRFSAGDEYPMAIPQVWVGRIQEYRVDFALFVPQDSNSWLWIAIEIDSPRFHTSRQADQQKESFLNSYGYIVQRYSATERALDQVRSFLRQYLHTYLVEG